MVKVSSDVAELLLKQKFEKLVFSCKGSDEWRVLYNYFGAINEFSIEHITEATENCLSTADFSKNTRKKAFAILIEGLQNIYRHGLKNEENDAIGAFTLLSSNSCVQLHFFNIIQNESIKVMNDYCQYLCTMPLEDVKALYMKTLSTVDMTEKGGASLGCMLIKLKSGGNSNYVFETMDKDMSSFHLTVSVFN